MKKKIRNIILFCEYDDNFIGIFFNALLEIQSLYSAFSNNIELFYKILF